MEIHHNDINVKLYVVMYEYYRTGKEEHYNCEFLSQSCVNIICLMYNNYAKKDIAGAYTGCVHLASPASNSLVKAQYLSHN